MKKILSILLLSWLAFSCNQDKKARISGTFSGLSGDTVVLEMIITQQRRIIDSAVISRQGAYSFRVKLPVAAPTFFNLLCNGSVIPLIVAPHEKVTVNSLCDLSKNYTVEGSDDSKRLQTFNTFYHNSLETLDSLSKAFILASRSGEEARQQALQKYTEEYYRIKREHIAFIVSNAESMAALYALYQRLPNDPYLYNEQNDVLYYRAVADSMAKRYPDSPHVRALQRDVEKKEEQRILANRIENQLDNPLNYPEIRLEDMYGHEKRLSELNGNVILIDFWSVKDSRSPVLNAEMRDLHDRYADKGLSIFQVSLGDEKAEWIHALQTQKLPWTSVLDPRGVAGIAAMSYNIASVPANVLIDKNGNVAGKNLFGDKLEAKIKELTR